MPHRLVLAEKPSVARDLARVLGVTGRKEGYLERGDTRVSWCVGHLVELAEPGAVRPEWGRWRVEDLPMLPEQFPLQARADGQDQWKVVKGLLRDRDLVEVINACDAGREGELIFAYAYQLAGCRAPVQRLWISSMTEAAIRDGFVRLRPGVSMRPLEDAARSRSEADWLVGLNATRAMTLRVRQGGGDTLLSLGRVQTPVLAMLVDREQQIRAFVPQDFWQLRAQVEVPAGGFTATRTVPDARGQDQDRLFDRAEAEALLERVRGQHGRVLEVKAQQKAEPPPLLYDLTTLQREANRRLGLSAQQTLDLAQSLYEARKVLTYPRTDSRHLPSDLAPRLRELVASLGFGPYQRTVDEVLARWPVPLGARVIDDAEVSDHHAIVPTGVDVRERGLTPPEKRLFDLVARRFLAVMCQPAVFATAQVRLELGGEPFAARGRQCLEPGWQRIDPPPSTRQDEVLPPMQEGEPATQRGLELHAGQTRPPKRYTEATLLGAMERAGEGLEEAELRRAMKRAGLGTPATRAAILETLLRRGYIRRVERDLWPTPTGEALIQALPGEDLRSPRLTGRWEARLWAIAEGEESREAFMADVRALTARVTRSLLGAPLPQEVLRELSPPLAEGERLGECPRCGGEVRAARAGWRCVGCTLSLPGVVAEREISARMARSLLQKGRTEVVKGFRSRAKKPFAAALVLDEQGKVVFEFPEAEALGPCPACGAPVRERKAVYSCDTGRECPFAVFRTMSGLEIPADAVRALLGSGRSGVLQGFTEREGGASYDGALVWREGRVRVVRADPREEAPSPGACPRCGGEVRFGAGAWRCGGCGLRVPGEVAGRPLRGEDVGRLLREGRTDRLYGFVQAGGGRFAAGLLLEPEGRVRLDYEAQDRAVPPPGAAFGEVLRCPLCIHRGLPEPGFVLAGHTAYGCSRWGEGCELRLPRVIDGLTLPDDEVRRFFGGPRETRLLKGFSGLRAGGRPCRVAFVPDAPYWTLRARGEAGD